MLIPFFVAAPVSAHHMAEGVVADDIYAMIDENLEGSPHLDLDLTTIGSMTIVSVTVAEEDVSMVLDPFPMLSQVRADRLSHRSM